MVVFISSVRRGLEEERDALPGLILALGHEPSRFEDFTSKPVPSREACLRGVEAADIYMLLLGPHYGDPVFDTGLSPTEEEFVVARRRGIPVLTFRKEGVNPDEKQEEFIGRVEEYTRGLFRNSFADATDLQTKVVAALREAEQPTPPLTWSPLRVPVGTPWMFAVERSRLYGSHPAVLETHLLPVDSAARIPATALDSLPRRLADLGRRHELFTSDGALDLDTGPDQATAAARGRGNDPQSGIRVRRDGAVCVWGALPHDGLGHILDSADLEERLTLALRLSADVIPSKVEQVAPALGLAPISFITEGSLTDLGRRSGATIGMPNQEWARVEPEDSLLASAIGPAAGEVAKELAARLLQRFRAIRR